MENQPNRTTVLTANRATGGWLSLFVMLAASLLALQCRANAAPHVLSEAAAVQQALVRSPSVVAARQRAEAARLLAGGTPGVAAPVLKLGAVDGLADNTSVAPQRRALAALQWSPPRPGELDAKRAVARARAEEMQALAEAEELNVALAARKAYRRLLVLRERIPLADEAQVLDVRLTGTEAALRQTQFAGPPNETARAEPRSTVPLREWESTLAHLAHLTQDTTLAARTPQNLQLDGATGDVAVKVIESGARSVADLLSAAVANRPEAKAAAARCRMLEADAALRDGDGRLTLRDVEVTYSTDREQRKQALGLVVGINLPFGAAAHRSGAVTTADRQACQAELNSVLANIRHQVAQDHLKRQAAVRDVEASVFYGLPLQDQAVKNMRSLWQERRVDEARVLRVELRRMQQRLKALDHIDELLQTDAVLRTTSAEPEAPR